MFPGYGSQNDFDPYLSPIYLYTVQPFKSGKNLIRLRFENAFYASGVREFDLTVRVLRRVPSHMVIAMPEAQGPRTAVIGEIGFNWLRSHHREWFHSQPPQSLPEPYCSDAQRYLDGRFFGT
jgi:hypothetical protein